MIKRFFPATKFVLAILLLAAPALAGQKFVANLSGAQEVPANNSNGKSVCTITLNSAETEVSVNCNYSGLSGTPSAARLYGNAAVGTNGDMLFDLTSMPGGFGGTFPVTAGQVADLRAKKLYINIHTTQFDNGEIRGQIKNIETLFDADGDGRSDPYVYRPGNNTFYFERSLDGGMQAQQFGQGSDMGSVCDFDGDGKVDLLAVRIDLTNGAATSFIFHSIDNTTQVVQWGNAFLNDAAALADFDGDGKLDIAAFRDGTGVWYILQSSTGTPLYEHWGKANDVPVAGDFDKDGKADLAVVRDENGQKVFYIRRSSNGAMQRIAWGLSSDFVFSNLSADVDGDGVTDPLVFRDDINGRRTFYALRSSDNQMFALRWGLENDTAIIGDYDGDGKTDFVARRDVGGQFVWYIYQSSNNQMRVAYWGLSTDD